MTIDERLDKLTERHEALTRTVELTARMQQENERRNQEAQHKNQVLFAEIAEDFHSLARIAQAHKHRISDLEGGR